MTEQAISPLRRRIIEDMTSWNTGVTRPIMGLDSNARAEHLLVIHRGVSLRLRQRRDRMPAPCHARWRRRCAAKSKPTRVRPA